MDMEDTHSGIGSSVQSKFNITYSIFLVLFFVGTRCISAQMSDSESKERLETRAKVTGLRYNNVHILELEKTLELYLDILGFKLVDAEVLKGALEGMLVLTIQANDYKMTLSLPPTQFKNSVGPIGNTNHNHFMLRVNDIGPIGDRLKEEGYQLENDNYEKDKYTFFTGPNGEIIGLSSWDKF